jgi:hypothetical protein
MDNITIGYLSWKRHSILNQTLISHKLNGLFDLIKPENRFIFFQEITQKDIEISNNFKCNYFGDDNNIGILNGFIKLIEKCETEYFIFSENDWYLIEDKDTTQKILEDCIKLFENDLCDIIRLRHKKNPGIPLYSKPKNPEEWVKQNINGFPYKLESLSWLDEPNKIYNNIFTEYLGNYKWYITTLNHQKWSNNIFIAKTSYLKNIILPLIKIFETLNNKYSGLEDILVKYNNYRKNNDINNIINLYDKTRIVGGNGLFTHQDTIL